MPTDVVLTQCHCLRCNHDWYPRKPGLPKTCPNCRSVYWNEPRRDQVQQLPLKPPRGDNG